MGFKFKLQAASMGGGSIAAIVPGGICLFLFMIFHSYRAINIFVFEFTDISSLKSAKVHRRDASFLKI